MAQVKPHRGPEQGVGPCPRAVGAVHAGFDHTIDQIEVLPNKKRGERKEGSISRGEGRDVHACVHQARA